MDYRTGFRTGAHTISSLDLGSLTEFAAPFGARAAAPAFLADQALRYSRLALPIVVGNVVGIITAGSIDFPGIIASAAAVVRLDLITFAKAAPAARRPRPRPRSVLLADEALRYARFPLAVVVGDVVRIVAAVSADLPRIEFAAAAVVSFYLIAFSQAIAASAVGVAAPAVKRRDEAGLDSRLALAVIIGHVETPISVDPRNFSWILLATTPARRNRPVNQGNCNFDAESVPVPRLHARTDTHAAARRAATPGPAPAPAAPTLLANEPGLDPRLSFPIVVGNILCCDRPGVMKSLEKYIRRRSLT